MKFTSALLGVLTVAILSSPLSAQAPVSEPRLNLKVPAWSAPRDAGQRQRSNIAPFAQTQPRRRSIWPTVVGAAIGGVVGVYGGMGILLSDEPCQPNCGPQLRKGFAVLIGAPIAGGVIGYLIGKR